MGIEILEATIKSIVEQIRELTSSNRRRSSFAGRNRRTSSIASFSVLSGKGSSRDSQDSFSVVGANTHEEVEIRIAKCLTTLELVYESASEAAEICDDLLHCEDYEKSGLSMRTQTVAITRMIDDVIQPLKFQV